MRPWIVAVIALLVALGALGLASSASAATCTTCGGDGGGGGTSTNKPPTAAFTVTTPAPAAGAPVAFDGSASNDAADSGGPIASYSWDFGDGSPVDTASGAKPSHTYARPGPYTVTLTVTDSDGGATSSPMSQPVTVSPSATVTFSGGTLSYVASPGGASNLTLSSSDPDHRVIPGCSFLVLCSCSWFCGPSYVNNAGGLTVTDPNVVLVAAAGTPCTQPDAHTLQCSWDNVTGSGQQAPFLDRIRIDTGDGTDHADTTGLSGAAPSASVDGGSGDDVLTGRAKDAVDYSGRSNPVTVDLGAHAGGETGEHDTLTGFEAVRGGTGADHLTGDARDNVLDGGPGNDAITGGGGTDTVDYSRRANPVTVTLSNGTGTGGESGEVDALSGIANVLGGAGADTIRTSDSSANHIGCGDGADHVIADGRDTADSDCEQTDISPRDATRPTVSGTARDGETLSADRGSWTGSPAPSYAYQWRRCDGSGSACADIGGATSSTYRLGHADVDHTVVVRVTGSNAWGQDTADSAATGSVAAAAPVNSTLPTITGPAQEGGTLTTDDGTWSGTPPSYAYQWRRCDADGLGCADIPGATSRSYTLGHDDVGHRLRMHLTATNAAAPGGVSVNSEPTGSIQPAPAGSTGGPAPGSGGATTPSDPRDTTPPAVSVQIPKQKLGVVLKKGLAASVGCSESCSLGSQLVLDGATAKRLHLAKLAKPVVLGTASGQATANARTTIVVTLTSKAKKALSGLRSVTLALRTSGRDAAGNVSPVVVTNVPLKR